jgi:hypothetical protein
MATGVTRAAYIDGKVQYGKGRAASVLGQTYNVFRNPTNTTNLPSPNINGSLTSSPPVLALYQAYVSRTTSKKLLENTVFDILVYEAKCDNRQLVIQDVLVQSGYENDGSVFTYAQRRPVPPYASLFVRTESTCTITRPYPISGQAAQQPTAGPREVKGWGGVTKQGEQFLTLVDGAYSFVGADDINPVTDLPYLPATIYCGLQPSAKISDTPKASAAGAIPTTLYRERFGIYIPDLPGVVLNELDRVNGPNNDRFEIMLYHNSDTVGLTGYVTVCEKLST